MRRLGLLSVLAMLLTVETVGQTLPNQFPWIFVRDSISWTAISKYRARVALRDTGWGIDDLNEALFNLIWAGGGSGSSTGQNNVLKSYDPGWGLELNGAKTDTTLWLKRFLGSTNILLTDMGQYVIVAFTGSAPSAVNLDGYSGTAADSIWVYTKYGWFNASSWVGGGVGGDADSAARAHTAVGLRSETGTASDTMYVRTKQGTWRLITGAALSDSVRIAYYSIHADTAEVAQGVVNATPVGMGLTAGEVVVVVDADSLKSVPWVETTGVGADSGNSTTSDRFYFTGLDTRQRVLDSIGVMGFGGSAVSFTVALYATKDSSAGTLLDTLSITGLGDWCLRDADAMLGSKTVAPGYSLYARPYATGSKPKRWTLIVQYRKTVP